MQDLIQVQMRHIFLSPHIQTAALLIHGYVLDEERKASSELPQLLLLLSHRLQVASQALDQLAHPYAQFPLGRSPQICTVSYSVTSKNVLLIP